MIIDFDILIKNVYCLLKNVLFLKTGGRGGLKNMCVRTVIGGVVYDLTLDCIT